jgi:hypothetical protein
MLALLLLLQIKINKIINLEATTESGRVEKFLFLLKYENEPSHANCRSGCKRKSLLTFPSQKIHIHICTAKILIALVNAE